MKEVALTLTPLKTMSGKVIFSDITTMAEICEWQSIVPRQRPTAMWMMFLPILRLNDESAWKSLQLCT